MAPTRRKHVVPRRAGHDGATPRSSGTRRAAPAPSRLGVRLDRGIVTRVALPVVGTLAVAGAAFAVVSSEPDVRPTAASVQPAAAEQDVSDDLIARALEQEDLTQEVTRSAERPALPSETETTAPKPAGTLLALSDGVTIHAAPDASSPVLGTLAEGQEVVVTAAKANGWRQVVLQDLPRWVRGTDLGTELPLGTEPCPVGSEAGLMPDTVKVLRAVCAEFPEVTSYGGQAGRGEHATGQALDIMARGELGDRIASFLQENQTELGIEYLIWEQRIWRPATSPDWRPMSNRGGDTANHIDHVHVTTYGSSATG